MKLAFELPQAQAEKLRDEAKRLGLRACSVEIAVPDEDLVGVHAVNLERHALTHTAFDDGVEANLLRVTDARV